MRPSATGVETERENGTKTIAVHGEALAARELAQASDAMMAHPLALQLRNPRPGSSSQSTRTPPSSSGALMSTIGELGAFLTRESKAAVELAAVPALPSASANGDHAPSQPSPSS